MKASQLIAHFGSVTQTADWFGITRNAVTQWYYKGDKLPPAREAEVKRRLHHATRRKISRLKPWAPQQKVRRPA